jgi:lipoprotein-anchoring transpeptidase ErfK/SrfK
MAGQKDHAAHGSVPRRAAQLEGLSRLVIGIGLTAIAVLSSADANASVLIRIYRSSQVMTVRVDGALYSTWAVSTARRGYRTPMGSFRAKRLEPVWYSSKYDSAPMPHSIFFAGGYAIHGTYAVGSLGRAVSHGCVRLSPAHASELFDLVKSHGLWHTRIVISMRAGPPMTGAAHARET